MARDVAKELGVDPSLPFWSILNYLDNGDLQLIGGLINVLPEDPLSPHRPVHLRVSADLSTVISAFFVGSSFDRWHLPIDKLRTINRSIKHKRLILGHEDDFWFQGTWRSRSSGKQYSHTTWACSYDRALCNIRMYMARGRVSDMSNLTRWYTTPQVVRIMKSRVPIPAYPFELSPHLES